MLSKKDRIEAIKWITSEYSRLLKYEISEEEAGKFLSMESKSELESYVKGTLDFLNPRAAPFMVQILKYWEEENKHKENKPATRGHANDDDVENHESPTKGKKTKFVPLFGTDGKDRTVAKLPGRHACECQASKHKLVNNCLQCGRIVCEQEGSGPCFFCGNLVCSSKEQEILSTDYKKGQKLREYLMNRPKASSSNHKLDFNSEFDNGCGDDDAVVGDGKKEVVDENLRHAIRHKEKLLEYDKNSVKRTQVIDDENDYFSTTGNKWLTDEEKKLLDKKVEELRAQRFASRLGPCKVTFDFEGRRVIEAEQESYDAIQDSAVMAANFGTNGRNEEKNKGKNVGSEGAAELFDLKVKFIRSPAEPSLKLSSFNHNRHNLKVVQDGDLQMSVDQGMALSMHQPWASLLIAGIKKHEGRTWYTNHRGPLWIASTVKRPDQSEIDNIEAMYKALYLGKRIKFPESYPPSVLLGRVVVTDCLSQEDYKVKFPNGESESPYVFICENPSEMKINLPIRGRQKIYSLDSHIVSGAKKLLEWKQS